MGEEGGEGEGGGGGGADQVLQKCLCRYHCTDVRDYGGHILVDMTPRPCAYAQGPKKSTPRPSWQSKQLELSPTRACRRRSEHSAKPS